MSTSTYQEPRDPHTGLEVFNGTIGDAEKLAEREANFALAEARGWMKKAANALRPVARSPLFGNGLHKGLTNAVAQMEDGDDALEKLQKALHDHFRGDG